MSRFDLLAFDADDTLWHNERLYAEAQMQFRQLLSRYHPPEWIDARLYQTEIRNLEHFGYGIKAFALSMIETAIELTEGRISAAEIGTIVERAHAMLTADVELLPHVAEVLPPLAEHYPLMLVTKGDLLDQEKKISRSGLQECFRWVEIVTDKTQAVYAAILQKHDIPPDRFLMIGNSLRSDILPVLALGAGTVHIPHALTWAHESATPPPEGQPGFYQIEHMGLLPGLLARLEG